MGRPVGSVKQRTPFLYERDLAHLRRMRAGLLKDEWLDDALREKVTADIDRLDASLSRLLAGIISSSK